MPSGERLSRALGQKAEIISAIQTVDPVGHFLIDFDADHPAAPFPRDVSLQPAPTLRALNAIELARVVHDFSKRLQKGESARPRAWFRMRRRRVRG